ncbi:uncharacterized protein JCM15063_004882 [Sporobolomyces koalae]|uniref:uncharacterized protein n=1 Tax=Sporobolomyces koalae TaxID=500713 RepID=UPI00317AB6B4
MESQSHSSFSTKSSPLPNSQSSASSRGHVIVMEGYLLKKKRKKMQGMARRYFRLDHHGALSYSFAPDSPVRDSLSVPISYISARRKSRSLDIDGGNTVYHCKALSVEDFEKWAAALQRFTKKSNEGPGTPLAAVTGIALSPVSEDPPVYNVQVALEKAESMNEPLQELQLILQELRSSTASPHFSPNLSTSPNSNSYLSPDSRSSSRIVESTSSSGSSGGGGTLFRFLGKRSNSQSGTSISTAASTLSVNPPSPNAATGSTSPTIPTPRSSSFASARKPSFSHTPARSPSSGIENSSSSSSPNSTATPTSPSGENESFFDAVSAPPNNPVLLQRFSTTLEQLRSTQVSLIESLKNLDAQPRFNSPLHSPAVGFNPAFSFGGHPRSPGSTWSSSGTPGSGVASPATSTHYASRSTQGFYPTHTRGTPSRASSRASFSSFFSADEGDGPWDDAASSIVEGEFVLDDGDEDDEDEDDDEEDRDEEEREQGRESRNEDEEDREKRTAAPASLERDDSGGQSKKTPNVVSRRRRSTIAEVDEEDAEFDQGEETDEEVLAEEEKKRQQQQARTGRNRSQTTTSSNYALKVQRRKSLPAQSGAEEGLLGLAKQVIGKDLSNISLPVTTNEPISALQRIAEELEYTELLDRAVAATDPLERLTLITVFAISTYGGNKFRVTRKPFNPLLGETFEWIRPDKGFKFIGEKVSHQPLVLAFHADSKLDTNDRGWQVDGDLATSTTIWGRSMEILVKGHHSISLTPHQEQYTIRRPSSFVRNLLLGTPYLEVAGDLIITCPTTGSKSIVSFKEGSSWGGASSRNKVQGKVLDPNGKLVHELVGKWDESVDRKVGKDQFERLWQIKDFPSNPRRYYGFSYFALELNETTQLDSLHAPTDSRLRPDQLALERGDLDQAEKLKKQVEEKQREKRKNGQSTMPMWFKEQGETWTYEGKYFDTREKEAFEDPDIF